MFTKIYPSHFLLITISEKKSDWGIFLWTSCWRATEIPGIVHAMYYPRRESCSVLQMHVQSPRETGPHGGLRSLGAKWHCLLNTSRIPTLLEDATLKLHLVHTYTQELLFLTESRHDSKPLSLARCLQINVLSEFFLLLHWRLEDLKLLPWISHVGYIHQNCKYPLKKSETKYNLEKSSCLTGNSLNYRVKHYDCCYSIIFSSCKGKDQI